MNVRHLFKNAYWGLRWGLAFASLFCLWALVVLLLGGEAAFEKQGITFLEVIVSYIGGGAAAGLVVGILKPLVRWAWGAALVGILAGIPAVLAFMLATEGSRWTSFNSLLTVAITSVLLGAPVGLTYREIFMGKQLEKE